ncbi:MAG: cytochrome c biogenesis CcdA family protein [Streptosporangiaceae bacterium]
MSGVAQLVTSGPLILALPVAAAAGAVTFLSPCCLPLVPGYLSFVTGMAGASGAAPAPVPAEPAAALAVPAAVAASTAPTAPVGLTAPAGLAAPAVPARPRAPRARVVAGTALFVLGFSVVFVAYGAALGGLGHLLTGHARLLTQILGGLTILLGLLFAGAFDRFSFAGRIIRPSARPKAGLAGAPLLGVMFGLGWTPCIGPTLTAVLALSASTGTVARGAILAFVYALGLGIPFLLVSLGFQVAMRVSSFARRRARLVTRIGGAMLVCVGLLEVTGAWSTFMAWLQVHWITGYQPPL